MCLLFKVISIYSNSVLCNHVENMVEIIQDFNEIFSLLSPDAHWFPHASTDGCPSLILNPRAKLTSLHLAFYISHLGALMWVPYFSLWAPWIYANTRAVKPGTPFAFQELLCYSHWWGALSTWTNIHIAPSPPLTPLFPDPPFFYCELSLASQDGKSLDGLCLFAAHTYYTAGICPNYATPSGSPDTTVISLMSWQHPTAYPGHCSIPVPLRAHGFSHCLMSWLTHPTSTFFWFSKITWVPLSVGHVLCQRELKNAVLVLKELRFQWERQTVKK